MFMYTTSVVKHVVSTTLSKSRVKYSLIATNVLLILPRTNCLVSNTSFSYHKTSYQK